MFDECVINIGLENKSFISVDDAIGFVSDECLDDSHIFNSAMIIIRNQDTKVTYDYSDAESLLEDLLSL